jgi:murein DD-endopeptidase MepM/ murein hydrolase activator NlpD
MPLTSDPRFTKIAAAVAAILTLAAVTAFGVAPIQEAEMPPVEMVVESVQLAPVVAVTSNSFRQTERVRRGETVPSLLERLGAADAELLRFVANDPIARKLTQLEAGRSVTADIDRSGRVLALQYRYGSLMVDGQENGTRLTIRRHGDQLEAIDEPVPLEREVALAAVTINSSLFAATDSAGIPDGIASQIADIFDADIDFRRDLRRGAQLRVAYETLREADSLDTPVGTRVLAVELLNGGDQHEAVRFDRGTDDLSGEFFTFNGQSLRKAFLRNPLEFSRISSGFTNARLHPLHGDVRAHKGVDFAAPSGTQVRAAGAGVVEFAGQQRGYGKVVILKHRNDISTLYAHLRDFTSGLSSGDKVEQGDVIGHVGMTGWATGPHLHYEFLVNGQQVDPMSVAAADSEPLKGEERDRFLAQAAVIQHRMAQLDPLRVAARFE